MKSKQLTLFDDDMVDPNTKMEIQYTTAYDENGDLIHIDKAEKGKLYYCPECKNDFILRKSGNTGPRSKRPHFAHKNLNPNCTPEGVLHHSFKKYLVDLLENYRSENKPLSVNWRCDSCLTDYPKKSLVTNLMIKTASIEEEYNLKVCRPDIALIDKEGEVIAAIEIVVTHEPEENALQYYKENGITLIQINLSSEDDLHKIEEKINNPDIVNLCLSTNCSNYKNHAAKKRLMYKDLRCKQCSHPVRVCRVEIDSVFGTIISSNYTNEDLQIVQSNGVRFKKGTKEKHLTFSCQGCEEIEKRKKLYYKRMRSKYKKNWRL